MTRPTKNSAKMIFSAVTGGALALLISTGVALAEMDKGDANMVLQTAKAQKPAVFPHARHQDLLDCATCHHSKNEDGSQNPFVAGQKIQKCITCHNSQDMADTKLNSFKNVGHINCKECHRAMAEAGKPTGPTKCNGCHTKI